MIDKRVATLADAVVGVGDGATVLVGGFGDSGVPGELCTPCSTRGPPT